MKIEEILDIYSLILLGTENNATHKQAVHLRKLVFSQINNEGLVKVAFDTRRVDQENTFISRRGLQHYNRSEEFISQANYDKLKNLIKIKDILEELRSKYGSHQSWLDSYCRILLNSLNKVLRIDQKDGDFTDNQPGVGSIDYIEEMLFVRYRISLSEVQTMTDDELKKIILSKDPELDMQDIHDLAEIKRSDIVKDSYGILIDKLFGSVRVSKDSPEVERTITITIKDKLVG